MSEKVKMYRDAAKRLESMNCKSAQEIQRESEEAGALGFCCGTCTLISQIPPCIGGCIRTSNGGI